MHELGHSLSLAAKGESFNQRQDTTYHFWTQTGIHQTQFKESKLLYRCIHRTIPLFLVYSLLFFILH